MMCMLRLHLYVVVAVRACSQSKRAAKIVKQRQLLTCLLCDTFYAP